MEIKITPLLLLLLVSPISPLKMLFFADQGDFTASSHLPQVFQSMSAHTDADLILAAGDNFYPGGLLDEHDPRFA